MGELTAEQAQEVRVEFAWVMAQSVTLPTPTMADYELAAELLQNLKSGLRADDALHLATAYNQGPGRSGSAVAGQDLGQGGE